MEERKNKYSATEGRGIQIEHRNQGNPSKGGKIEGYEGRKQKEKTGITKGNKAKGEQKKGKVQEAQRWKGKEYGKRKDEKSAKKGEEKESKRKGKKLKKRKGKREK